MENKSDITSESTKIGPGDVLTFGSVNLLLTLNLDKNDFTKYKINWEELSSLNDLKFIIKNKLLWKRVELTSNNETMNIILYINKTSPKLIKIGYVALKKIIFKEKEEDFKEFIFSVIKQNGLFITSCDICNCTISIQLLLKYEEKEKIFVLCGKSIKIKKQIFEKIDNNNEENDEHINNSEEEFEDNKNNEEITEDNKNNEEETEDNKNNDIKENSKEEKIDVRYNIIEGKKKKKRNPFIYIYENNINISEFNYIYFNFIDCIEGEFKEQIRLEHLFEFFQDIKIRTKSKIILNFEEETEIFAYRNENEIFKDLLSITDLFIFYNKNKLFDVLKDLKKEEDQHTIDESYKFNAFEVKRKLLNKEKLKQQEEEWEKNYKMLLEKYGKEKITPKHLTTEGSNINNSKKYLPEKTNNNEYKNINILKRKNKGYKNISANKTIHQNKNEESKKNRRDQIFQRSKSENSSGIFLMPIRPSSPQPLNKNDMFDYFKDEIIGRDPQRKTTDKIILVLEEFNKIFIVKCKKNLEKPVILDFDLKLYPQVNIRNMDDVLEYKQFIKNNFKKYVEIFIGSLLNTVASKGKLGFNDEYLFLGYLVATNIIKKISEIERFNLSLPKNKYFYYPSITNEELDKLLAQANLKKKEKSFILDGNNRKNLVILPYNPLLDKNLCSYLNTKKNINYLQEKGFIGKNGKIMYDPNYKETLGNQTKRNIRNVLQRMRLNNLSKDKKIQENSKATNKFLVGYRNKSPGYSIYNRNQKNYIKLPPINIKNKASIEIETKKNIIIKKPVDDNKSNNGIRNNINNKSK